MKSYECFIQIIILYIQRFPYGGTPLTKKTQNACQSSVCVLLDDDEGRGNVKPLLTLLPGPYQPGVIMHRCTLSLGSHRTVTPAV